MGAPPIAALSACGSVTIMNIAVAGATGTSGRVICDELARRGLEVTPLTRGSGVDLLTGDGLREALADCSAVIDASNVVPADDHMSPHDAVVTATDNLVAACADAGVGRYLLLSIINIDDPGLAEFDYYRAKLDQEAVAREAALPSVVVRSAQWFDFAVNPAAVTCGDEAVQAQDWSIQPIALTAVARELVDAATSDGAGDASLAGLEPMRLPQLTSRYLAARGDDRPVTPAPPLFPAFGDGALLPRPDAKLLGPTLAQWLTARKL